MDIKEYIQGKKHGKEANRLEREALNDPFLQDALEGYETIQGEHLHTLESLENQITKRTTRIPERNKKRFWAFGIAASIVLLVGTGALFIFNHTLNNNPALTASKNYTDSILHYGTEEIIIPRGAFDDQDVVIAKEETKRKPDKTTPHIASPPVQTNAIEDSTTDEIIANEGNDNFREIPTPAPVITDIQRNNSQDTNKKAHTSLKPESKATEINKATRKVKGRISDETGEPLIGASVVVEGTSIGAVTDFDGNYEIEVPVDNQKQLVAKYIGYESKQIPVTDSPQQIQLETDNQMLDEVVVVGYGTQKKQSMTGSVSTVRDKKKNNKKEKANNIAGALEGKKAGITVVSAGDSVNDNSNIRIRGIASTSEPHNSSTELKLNDKEQFLVYFEKNRKQEICEEKPAELTIKFYINEDGKPTDIKINKSSCKELEEEVIRLLEAGPKWSATNSKMKFKIIII